MIRRGRASLVAKDEGVHAPSVDVNGGTMNDASINAIKLSSLPALHSVHTHQLWRCTEQQL